MKIEFLDALGNEQILSKSEKFVNDYYSDPSSCAEILVNQINKRENIYKFLSESMWRSKFSSVIDLGANIGLFSIFISPLAECVYALEPTPEHINMMKELASVLGIKNIKPYEIAISTYDGISEFQVHKRNSTMNSFMTHRTDHVYGDSIEVETQTLSSIIKTFGIEKVDFLKMDIEGFERQLILDSSFDEAVNKVNMLYIEVHDFEDMGLMATNYKDIENKFVSLGRKVVQLTEDGMLVR